MSDSKDKRGGADRNQGRKRIKEGEVSVVIKPSLSQSQALKYQRLGGHTWLRRTIDDAPEPHEDRE